MRGWCRTDEILAEAGKMLVVRPAMQWFMRHRQRTGDACGGGGRACARPHAKHNVSAPKRHGSDLMPLIEGLLLGNYFRPL
jgi:hypothetical protein